MPTKNPRLSVVLSPSLAATLAALSHETGDSASSLVRGLLDQAHPALERMLDLVKAAKAAKGQISQGVGHALQRVVDDLEDAQALADARTRRAVRDLVDQAQAIKGRRVARARPAGHGEPAAPGNPPASNRGVRSSTEGAGKPRKPTQKRA